MIIIAHTKNKYSTFAITSAIRVLSFNSAASGRGQIPNKTFAHTTNHKCCRKI